MGGLSINSKFWSQFGIHCHSKYNHCIYNHRIHKFIACCHFGSSTGKGFFFLFFFFKYSCSILRFQQVLHAWATEGFAFGVRFWCSSSTIECYCFLLGISLMMETRWFPDYSVPTLVLKYSVWWASGCYFYCSYISQSLATCISYCKAQVIFLSKPSSLESVFCWWAGAQGNFLPLP